MCWCAIPRNPPVPAETPAMPAVVLTEVAKASARGQLLARVASALASHGVLPYLSRSYIFFFLLGSCPDAAAQLKAWGIPLPDGGVTFIDSRTAEMFLATGSEQGTLACAELQGMLNAAMATIRANNRFAAVLRPRETVPQGAPGGGK